MRTFVIAALGTALVMGACAADAVELVYNGNFDQATGGFAIGWYGNVAGACANWGVLDGNSVRCGGANNVHDWLAQDVDFGSVSGSALFTVDTYITTSEAPGHDMFAIQVGPFSTLWLDVAYFTGRLHWEFDVGYVMGTGVQMMSFVTKTDASLPSSMYVDNVSIAANPVPEPVSLLVLGAGLAALAARRKHR